MSGIVEKAKDMLSGGERHEEEASVGPKTTGEADAPFRTAFDTIPGSTTGATPYETTTTAATGMGEGATCGEEHFIKVEDRPRVIERREYYKEHIPVEKEFVVETKFVGERELQEGRTTEVLGTEERVIAEAPPKAPCD